MSTSELEDVARKLESEVRRLQEENVELRERVEELERAAESAVVESIWSPSQDHPEHTVVIFADKNGWEALVAALSPKQELEKERRGE